MVHLMIKIGMKHNIVSHIVKFHFKFFLVAIIYIINVAKTKIYRSFG